MRNKWTSSVFGDNFAEEEDEDQDSLKEALLETPAYLLVLTAVVSILHSVFELLAFKNGKIGRGIENFHINLVCICPNLP